MNDESILKNTLKALLKTLSDTVIKYFLKQVTKVMFITVRDKT